MKKLKLFSVVSLLAICCSLTAFAVEQKRMSVQVKQGTVRSTPSFLGKVITRLNYGDQVVVQTQKDSWSQISMPGVHARGWMHISALSSKKIVLKPGASDVEKAASSDELTLAGRGFNQQVEDEFKSENPKVDFTWVNRMEKFVVTQYQIQTFIREGGLTPKGGTK
jgi:hypothetical protein